MSVLGDDNDDSNNKKQLKHWPRNLRWRTTQVRINILVKGNKTIISHPELATVIPKLPEASLSSEKRNIELLRQPAVQNWNSRNLLQSHTVTENEFFPAVFSLQLSHEMLFLSKIPLLALPRALIVFCTRATPSWDMSCLHHHWHAGRYSDGQLSHCPLQAWDTSGGLTAMPSLSTVGISQHGSLRRNRHDYLVKTH